MTQPRALPPASPVQRLGAFCIDATFFWLATFPVFMLVAWLVGLATATSGASRETVEAAMQATPLAGSLLLFPARGYLESRAGATPGKWTLGLRVSAGTARRHIVRGAMAGPCLAGGIPMLAAAARADRRALHDLLCGAQVTSGATERRLSTWWVAVRQP